MLFNLFPSRETVLPPSFRSSANTETKIMSLPNAYSLKTASIPLYFSRMLDTEIPNTFDASFMTSIGFRYAIDRSFIDILKELHFLSLNGMPTKRYIDFHGRSRAKTALQDGIREAYSLLFDQLPDADQLGAGRVVEALKQLYDGKKSDMMINGIANTFVTLCRYARETDFAAFGEEPAPAHRPDAPLGDDGPAVAVSKPVAADVAAVSEAVSAAQPPVAATQTPQADIPTARDASPPSAVEAEPEPIRLELESEIRPETEAAPSAVPAPATQSMAAPEPESLILVLESETDASPSVAARPTSQAAAPEKPQAPQAATSEKPRTPQPAVNEPEPILLELESEIRPEAETPPAAAATPETPPAVATPPTAQPRPGLPTLEPAERAALMQPLPPEPPTAQAEPADLANAPEADAPLAGGNTRADAPFVLHIAPPGQEAASVQPQAAGAAEATGVDNAAPRQAASDACSTTSCPIQIVLPHTSDVAVYDAIFASLKRHLLSSE